MHEQHHGPTIEDDAGSLASIVLPAILSIAITGSILSRIAVHDTYDVSVTLSEVEVIPVEVDAAAGADRIYGRVVTTDGSELTGYLRWNGREASWADVLQATRLGDNSFSGVRFGHVQRMEPVDSRTARLTLKSGDVVELSALMAEGQTALRALAVEETPGEPGVEIQWRDVESVELLPEPIERAPAAERLHGTVVTKAGMVFTGYLTWDGERGYASDLLEGELVTGEGAVPFGRIASIQKSGDDRALVSLVTGEQGIVQGTREMSASNRGITVSDPGLGVVVVPWSRFRELRLHAAEVPAAYEAFEGGRELTGRLVTRSGEELSGRIRWDRDESATWDMLDGQLNEIRFRIEMGQIASIERFRFGAAVDLRDGRSFYLSASQDVSWTNRGIEVQTGRGTRLVPWDDFGELTLDAPSPPAPGEGDGEGPESDA